LQHILTDGAPQNRDKLDILWQNQYIEYTTSTNNKVAIGDNIMSTIPENEISQRDALLASWGEIRIGLEVLDKDLTKGLTKGNVAAGRRARGKMRTLKKELTLLMKNMVKLEKNKENA